MLYAIYTLVEGLKYPKNLTKCYLHFTDKTIEAQKLNSAPVFKTITTYFVSVHFIVLT